VAQRDGWRPANSAAGQVEDYNIDNMASGSRVILVTRVRAGTELISSRGWFLAISRSGLLSCDSSGNPNARYKPAAGTRFGR
jgi:hypothetical protein